MRFAEIRFELEFDGIWACGSLLHVPRSEMEGVVEKLGTALKPGGVMYMSFKLGEQDEIRNGRLFTNYTETTFPALLASIDSLELLNMWSTKDVRTDAERTEWLNALLRRR